MKKFSSFKKTKEADEGSGRKGESVSESPSVSGIDSSSSSSSSSSSVVDDDDDDDDEEEEDDER